METLWSGAEFYGILIDHKHSMLAATEPVVSAFSRRIVCLLLNHKILILIAPQWPCNLTIKHLAYASRLTDDVAVDAFQQIN